MFCQKDVQCSTFFHAVSLNYPPEIHLTATIKLAYAVHADLLISPKYHIGLASAYVPDL